MLKMPNGYGSVTKLSGRRRNPYMVRITMGRDDYGQIVRKVLGYYHTKADALQALADYNHDPYDLSADKLTFAQAYEMWSARHYPTVSDPLAKRYTQMYTICAPIADKPLANLKLIHLQALVDAQPKYHTRSHLKLLMSQVYDFAIQRDIIATNYAARVDTGKDPGVQNPHKPFAPDEITALWARSDEPIPRLALILIYTGMRVGELAEMRTANVHLDERYMIGGLKTDAGKNRIIPIHHKILPLIAQLYDPAAEYLIMPHRVANAYQRPFTAAIPGHRTHDCRHTFASLMDVAGANRSALKRIMGHSNGGDITDTVYIHKTVADLLQNVELISL